MTKRRSSSSSSSFSRILAIIGAIVAIVFGIMGMITINPIAILLNLLIVVMSIILLASCGVVRFRHTIPWEWWTILIFGILIAVLGQLIGGIIIIVAAILKLMNL